MLIKAVQIRFSQQSGDQIWSGRSQSLKRESVGTWAEGKA